jgi:hypothetical protein
MQTAFNPLADLSADLPKTIPSHAKLRERPLEELYAVLVRHDKYELKKALFSRNATVLLIF